MSKICPKCSKEVSNAKWQYNKEMCKNCAVKEYYTIPENKEKRKKYEQSQPFKDSMKKYADSSKGKKARKRFTKSEKGISNRKRKQLTRTENEFNIIHDFTQQEWEELKNKTNGYCPDCKKFVGVENLTLDHIHPVSKAIEGQIYTIYDVQPLCQPCNSTKGNNSTQKEVKSKNFYLIVYDLIKENHSPKDICSRFNISKQKLQYYLNTLKNKGYIKKIGYGTWEVKKEVKTFSLGTKADKPLTNLHALNIKFPILQGKIYDKDWQVKEKLKNWIPKYKEDLNLGGLTIKNNNNKSITVYAKSRDISNMDQVDILAKKIQSYVYSYFKKDGVILDIINCETKNLNLATQDEELKPLMRKSETFTLDLNKKSEKIFPNDNINAKAWLDNTPKPGSAETNDKEWKREYLTMPFRIRDSIMVLNTMSHNLAYVAENYKSHVSMVEKGTKVQEESLKLFKKLNKALSQKKLKEFF